MIFQTSQMFFFLLLVCCQLCGQVRSLRNDQLPGSNEKSTFVDFLKTDNKEIVKAIKTANVFGQDGETTVNNIESPFLAATDGVMIALAEVGNNEPNKEKIILAKYIETKKENWGSKALIDTDGNWEVKLATKKVEKTKTNPVLKSFAVVAKNEKIYHITVSNDTLEETVPSEPLESPPAKWHVRLVEGTVTNNGGSGTKKEINWKSSIISVKQDVDHLENKLSKNPSNIPPSDGFAFVTDNKNIYFIMKSKDVTSSSSSNDINITAVFMLEESENTLKLLHVEEIGSCYPSFFQWEEKIIMTPTFCPLRNSHNVKMFDEAQKKFIDTTEPIIRLKKFLEDKNNFTTATIKRKKMLLFTQQKFVQRTGNNGVFLWMYDGSRVGFIGTLFEHIQGTFYGSILHTGDQLFALHQQYGSDGKKQENKFTFKHLKAQLDNITDTLTAWDKSDGIVSKLCEKSKNPKISCNTSLPIGGIVGFLHNTTNENPITEWKDEYFYANASVQSGSKVENGLRFNGQKAGAKWLVGNEQGDQPYNFIDFGFTLVATVTIDSSTNAKENSILGVALTSNTNTNKSVGLWCNTDGDWGVTVWDGQQKAPLTTGNTKCEQGMTYNVALVLDKENKRNLKIYVNGEQLNDLKHQIITFEKENKVTHFYFGADIGTPEILTTTESHVTVTNVLLYNRPFNDSEIENLTKYIKTNEVAKLPREDPTINAQRNEQTPTSLSPSSDEKKEKDGGVGGGVRVFSLLLALLCVSAPLLHL